MSNIKLISLSIITLYISQFNLKFLFNVNILHIISVFKFDFFTYF